MNTDLDLHAKPIGNSLWRAGAGAGKTYNLVKRVMRIAEDWSAAHSGTFPRLVVTTFTRMATQELRVRLMEAALTAAAQGKSDLIPFVTSRSQLFVTTLHGVMDSFLRSFGSEIGLEPGFRVGGAEEIESLVRRVGKRILFPTDTASSGQIANEVDSLLGEFDFSTTLRLLQRVSRLRIEFGETEVSVRPATVLDMKTSIVVGLQSLIPSLVDLKDEISIASDDAKWTPFTAWLGRLIEKLKTVSVEDLAVEQLSELLVAEPKIINSAKSKHHIDFGAGSDWKDPIKAVDEMLENVRSEILALDNFEKVNSALAVVEREFSVALRAEKLRAGLIELEDLELFALELIRKSPQSAETYALGWDHWLIDEYQDTSPRQVFLIEALANGRPQFVVGDPQQSIYLFRGARPNVFLDREEAAEKEKHEKIRLLGNRRSHPEVMKFINHVVHNLGDEFQTMTVERENQANFGCHASSRPSPLGAVTLLSLEVATRVDNDGKTKPLRAEDLRRIESEQLAIAARRLLFAGASPASIAVLGRSNKDLAIVAREFANHGLPFQVHTAGAYSDRLEVADLCALLAFLSNPHDDVNLIHLARTAWFPIDENTLVKGYRRKSSLWSTLETELKNEPGEHQEIEALAACLIAARERGLVQAFREMLTTCDFFSWCGVLDSSGRREANALKFIAKLAVAERQAGFIPRRFNDEIMAGGDRGGEGESNDRDAVAAAKPDRIHIMTIHVSKGLEFDHVFLPFLNDAGGKGRVTNEFVFHEKKRIWTVGLSVDDDAGSTAGPLSREWNGILRQWGVEEQKRLLYVALTRARESLFLSATGEAKPNSFLDFLRIERNVGKYLSHQVISVVSAETDLYTAANKLSNLRATWSGSERTSVGSEFANISVSRLLELEEEKTAHVHAKSGDEAGVVHRSAKRSLAMAVAAARGTRLHRVFEMAKMNSADSEILAREIARWFSESEQEPARRALRWLLELREPKMAQVLASGEVEWSFTYVRDSYAVDGQIDLWGRDSDGRLWVVDYKTGDSSYKGKALKQLKYYAEALRAGGIAKSDETIFLCALYPFSEEIFTEKLVLE